MGAQQSRCGESEALHERPPPGMPIGVCDLDTRGYDLPAALRGTDMNWNVLHICSFVFLISAWLCIWLTLVGIHNPNASKGSASAMIQTAHRSRIFPDSFFF
jgi:hypothetical protein